MGHAYEMDCRANSAWVKHFPVVCTNNSISSCSLPRNESVCGGSSDCVIREVTEADRGLHGCGEGDQYRFVVVVSNGELYNYYIHVVLSIAMHYTFIILPLSTH